MPQTDSVSDSQPRARHARNAHAHAPPTRKPRSALFRPLFPLIGPWAAAWLLAAGSVRAAELVIVIDDVGYSLARAERIVRLPGPVTLGLLPYAPHARAAAALARTHDKEIILHQPMEPVVETRVQDEPGTLKLSMTEARFESELSEALARLPEAVGVNNHTGSLLTTERVPMRWLMAGIARRGLFFLDSRTTPHTVAESMARELRVPTIRRDVFLDHVQSAEFLEGAFAKSLAIARRKGRAVVIGHPYRITLEFLEARLAELPDDVRLTTLASLLEPVRAADRTVFALPGSPAFPSR